MDSFEKGGPFSGGGGGGGGAATKMATSLGPTQADEESKLRTLVIGGLEFVSLCDDVRDGASKRFGPFEASGGLHEKATQHVLRGIPY